MKKIIIYLLVFVFIILAAGNSIEDEEKESTSSKTTASSKAVNTSKSGKKESDDNSNKSVSSKPTKKATPKPTKKPTPKPTKKPTPKPTKKPTPKPTPKPAKKEIGFYIHYEENLFFSKYRVNFYLDGKKLEMIDNGEEIGFYKKIRKGNHEIVLSKEGDQSICTSLDFKVTKSEVLYISCQSKKDKIIATILRNEKTKDELDALILDSILEYGNE